MDSSGFFLGTHQPAWLGRLEVPLMVSHRTLRGRRRLPRARCRWAFDSGGFSELLLHGGWRTGVEEYVEAVARYAAEIGQLAWAAPMDWMVEPFMLGRTGKTLERHQQLTVENYCLLVQLAAGSDLPFIPVVQGWRLADYEHCRMLFERAGIDLAAVPLVGLGSVCRRQATSEIGQIVTALANAGLRLHGFGVKRAGLARYGHLLESADSLAWSYYARRRPPLPGCAGHKNCANCIRAALAWRQATLATLEGPRQLTLQLGGAA